MKSLKGVLFVVKCFLLFSSTKHALWHVTWDKERMLFVPRGSTSTTGYLGLGQWTGRIVVVVVGGGYVVVRSVTSTSRLRLRSGQSTDNLNPSGAREQGTGHGSVNPTNGMIL